MSPSEASLRDELYRHVEVLSVEIGERNTLLHTQLKTAADYIHRELEAAGLIVTRQPFEAGGKTCENIVGEITGDRRAEEILVVGGHYDGVYGCPAANDNATGVAAMLALARRIANTQPARTLRFIGFVNEEPPFFQTEQMGSLVYARSCKQKGEMIVGMLSLETMGYYTDEPKSQHYPFPFGLLYPSTGNFIAFIGNTRSGPFIRDVVGRFRSNCAFPSEGAGLPGFIEGVGWSDHWSFWQEGYAALMVTDTAPYRYAHYHSPEDTIDKLDFERFAKVTAGLEKVIAELAEIR